MPKINELTPERSTRHLFGQEMRERRELAGWSQERLGQETGWTDSHISRIENAVSMPPPELPGTLDRLFSTDVFTKLYRVARTEQHPDKYRRRMELEARAVRIAEYAAHVVPGLVQTRDYARTLLREGAPTASADELAALVAARLSRQDLLRSATPPYLSMILDESVARRPIGNPAIMREQLSALLRAADSPYCALQLLPFSHGAHPLLGGSLSVFTFADGGGAAYEESISTGTLLEGREDVIKRQRSYDELRGHALSPRRSAALIREVMEALPA
ncbi:helix-turn-helix domain-containing protein [Kitasatospora sp. NPDC092286]|uniref:helix-turn-helix domain-containing protein n=1 Tax=Kitasatospora sp. NPDC092286 TaxID=3364087 RepID=UPI0037FD4E20